MKNIYYLLFAMVVCIVMACEPAIDDKIDIGSAPVASFDIEQGATPNDFTLRNTTAGAFITQWDYSIGSAKGEVVDLFISDKGEYDITMTTFNSGGSGTITKSLTVTQDAGAGCMGSKELLTDCDEKVWKLAQEEGALFVGSDLTNSYWVNSTNDLSVRACHFNDEYIFRENGDYEFDNKGDFWVDDDGNGNVWPTDLGLAPGCQSNDSWPEKYKPWGSNVHSFNATNNTLTVIGEGAWMGLYKVGTSSEVAAPQSSVTFYILELSSERMVLYTDYGGLVWRFTFVSE